METFITNTLEFLKGQSIQVAIVFVGVLILTWLLQNKSAHVRYLLWLLVAIKCLTPPLVIFSVPVLPAETVAVTLPPQNQTIEYQQAPIEQPKSTETVTVIDQPQQALPVSIEKRTSKIENPLTSTGVLLSAWTAGAACYLLWALGKAVRLGMQLRRIRKPLPAQLMIEQIEMLTHLWNYPGGFKVWLVDGIAQPFVWGLWRGAIYLPTRFQSIQGDKQKAIVLHEMAHVVRLDAFVNLIQILIQGVFWFHPLVWLANKSIRQEREKCCDEIAVARLGTAPKEYGSAIVDTLLQEAQAGLAIPTLAVAGPVKNIEDRIKTIMQPGRRFFHRPSTIALLVIGVLAAIVVPTTIALTQKATPPDYTLSGTVVDAQTAKPIAGAIVFDDGYGPEPYQKGITDDSGKFEYKSWNEEHNIAAKADGYKQEMMIFTTAPFDNSKNLNFKLSKSSDQQTSAIRIRMEMIAVPNEEQELKSLFELAGLKVPQFAMAGIEGINPQAGQEKLSYGQYLFLSSQDRDNIIKATRSNPQISILTSPQVVVASGEEATIEVSTSPNLPKRVSSFKMKPSITKDGISAEFNIFYLNTIGTEDDIDSRVASMTSIQSNILIPQDKTLLMLSPETFKDQNNDHKPPQRLLFLVKPQAETLHDEPESVQTHLPGDMGGQRADFKKRFFITIVVDKNNEITGDGQKITPEQLDTLLAKCTSPANTVLEVAFEPEAFPDIHTRHNDNPVFQKAGQWVEKYHLEYLSYVGEDHPENRRGPLSIRTEDAFVMDKVISINMPAIELNADKPLLTANTILFSSQNSDVSANLNMAVVSHPKRQWEIKIRLLDKDGSQIDSVVHNYQNSGVIKGVAAITNETLAFNFGTLKISKIAKFEIEVRQMPTDFRQKKERLEAMEQVRQAAIACLLFAGDYVGPLPQELGQLKPYLPENNSIPMEKIDLLQAGQKLSEIKDVAATALLHMQLNDGKDGAIVAYCDGHVEYFSPERMKAQFLSETVISPQVNKKADSSTESLVQSQGANGLIACWKFDENTGNVAYDSVSNNNAIIQGADWDNGISGSGLSFDGMNDYVFAGSSDSLDLTEFTWSLWIKRGEQWYSNERTLISTNQVNQHTEGSYSLQIDEGDNYQNKIQFVRHGDPFAACLWTYKAIEDTGWHHVAATRNNDGQVVLYIDGQKEAQGRVQTKTAFKGINIGAGDEAYSNFNGLIDEVAIYNRALSGDEIKSIYDSNKNVLLMPSRKTEEKAETIKQYQQFTAMLPNGTTIELAGVCRDIDKNIWHRPDGTVRTSEQFSFKNNSNSPSVPSTGRSILLARIQEPEDKWIRFWDISNGSDVSKQNVIDADGKRLNDYDAIKLNFNPASETTDVTFEVSSGSWTTLAEYDGSKDGMAIIESISFLPPSEQNGDVSLIITDSPQDDKDFRTVAVTKDGREIPNRSTSLAITKDFQQTTFGFIGLKLDEVKTYLYQTRPFHYVTFKDVSLKPGQKTDVKIEISETMSQTSDQPEALDSQNINYPKNWDEVKKRAEQRLRSNTSSLKNVVYDCSSLIESYSVMDMNNSENQNIFDVEAKRMHQIQLEIQQIVPESWASRSGQGLITQHSRTQLIVWQTPEVHKQIRACLDNKERELSTQVAIEARFILTNEEVLKQAGIDVTKILGTVTTLPADSNDIEELFKNNLLKDISDSVDPNLLYESQVQSLMELVRQDKNSRQLTAPKAMVLNKESVALEVFTNTQYTGTDKQKKEFKKGILLNVLPQADDAGENIKIKMHVLMSGLLRPQTQQAAASVPQARILDVSYQTTVPDKTSFWLLAPYGSDGPLTQEEVADILEGKYKPKSLSDKTSAENKYLLILIKPTIVIREEAPPSLQLPENMPGGMGAMRNTSNI